jgi:transposase
MGKVIGIDISKQTFDVSWKEKTSTISMVFPNNQEGVKSFFSHVKKDDHCVMEASGTYFLKLAMFLHNRKIYISVVNPLKIKRYSQMTMSRTKTDKKDAIMICAYGQNQKPERWRPDADYIKEMNNLLTTIEGYEGIAAQLSNRMEAEDQLDIINSVAEKSKEDILKCIDQEILKLMEEIEIIATKNCSETLSRLRTIPGIGLKTSLVLIAITGNFEYFDDVRALVAYCGLCPRIYESGTSIKGKGYICKMGNGRIRKMLYLCAWSAQRYNPECKELKERLTVKGKPPRVIKIAIANKLLRTVFGVVKGKTEYKSKVTKESMIM